MGKKFLFNEVKRFVAENSNCILLANEYIDQDYKMLFKCACGNEFSATFSKFKNSNKRQCNKCGAEKTAASRRLIFEEVKYFVEIESGSNCKFMSTSYNGNKSNLKFRCTCGNEFETTFHNFKGKHKRQCNECGNGARYEARKLTINEVRQFVNENSNCELLSTKYVGRGRNKKLKFKCGCGNEFERDFNNFKHSNQRYCTECSGGIKLDIENVKEFVKNNSKCILLSKEYVNNHTKMSFQCECGNIFETDLGNFKTFDKKRCDECSKKISIPELQALELLKKHNINFISQQRFNDCRNILPLIFDFYLPDFNMCIEIDGKQHNEPVKCFGGMEGLESQQKRDKIKEIYCNENNIKLLRIPHWEFNNMETILKNALP